MSEPYLTVRRHPYEEPYSIQMEFSASSGCFVGSIDIYCNIEALAQIGNALKSLPRFIGDEYRYEYGLPESQAQFTRTSCCAPTHRNISEASEAMSLIGVGRKWHNNSLC